MLRERSNRMNGLIRWDPFADLISMQKQFFGDSHSPFKSVNVPTTDVYVKDNNLVVEAHLPNFDIDNVSISIEDGSLVISAEKHEKAEDKDKQYVVHESSSSFYRSVSLPERADVNKIKADLVDGILKVDIPLTPLQEPKKIKIGSGKKS